MVNEDKAKDNKDLDKVNKDQVKVNRDRVKINKYPFNQDPVSMIKDRLLLQELQHLKGINSRWLYFKNCIDKLVKE